MFPILFRRLYIGRQPHYLRYVLGRGEAGNSSGPDYCELERHLTQLKDRVKEDEGWEELRFTFNEVQKVMGDRGEPSCVAASLGRISRALADKSNQLSKGIKEALLDVNQGLATFSQSLQEEMIFVASDIKEGQRLMMDEMKGMADDTVRVLCPCIYQGLTQEKDRRYARAQGVSTSPKKKKECTIHTTKTTDEPTPLEDKEASTLKVPQENTTGKHIQGTEEIAGLQKLQEKLKDAKLSFQKLPAVLTLQQSLSDIQNHVQEHPGMLEMKKKVEYAQQKLRDHALSSELRHLLEEAQKLMQENPVAVEVHSQVEEAVKRFQEHPTVIKLQRKVQMVEELVEEHQLVSELQNELEMTRRKLQEHPAMLELHKKIVELHRDLEQDPLTQDFKELKSELRLKLLACPETSKVQKELEEARKMFIDHTLMVDFMKQVYDAEKKLEEYEMMVVLQSRLKREQTKEGVEGDEEKEGKKKSPRVEELEKSLVEAKTRLNLLPTPVELQKKLKKIRDKLKNSEVVKALRAKTAELEETLNCHEMVKDLRRRIEEVDKKLMECSLSIELKQRMEEGEKVLGGIFYTSELQKRLEIIPNTSQEMQVLRFSSEKDEEGGNKSKPESGGDTKKTVKTEEEKTNSELVKKLEEGLKSLQEHPTAHELREKLAKVREKLLQNPGVKEIRKNAEKLLEEVANEAGRRKLVGNMKDRLEKMIKKMKDQQGMEELEKEFVQAKTQLRDSTTTKLGDFEKMMTNVSKETIKIQVGQIALKVQELYDKVTLPDEVRGELRKVLTKLEMPLLHLRGCQLVGPPLLGLANALESRASHETISKWLKKTENAINQFHANQD